jgi:hypothetical protein
LNRPTPSQRRILLIISVTKSEQMLAPHALILMFLIFGINSYYEAYATFFAKAIEEKGASATLDEFVFSERYNFQPGRDADSQPEMLCRFVDAVMHPLIHCGHGVEFGLKGMLAEGKSHVGAEEEESPLTSSELG